MTIEDQIKEIEDEIFKTQKNKATEHHIGKLKAKIARLRAEQEARKSSGGGGGHGYYVKKSGHATVALVGFPSVGKSTLLNKITDAHSEVGAYDFTTLDVVPGVMEYKGAKILVLDLPGLIKGAARGKGRGREVISAARAADLIILMVDVFRNDLDIIVRELYVAGVRLNEQPVNVRINKTQKGGLTVSTTIEMTKMDEEMVRGVVSSFGIINADVVIREDINEDQLIDYLSGNKVYTKGIVVMNKTDLLPANEIQQIVSKFKGWHTLLISANNETGLEGLRGAIFDALGFIRVFLKPQGAKADLVEPLVIQDASTVGMVCDYLHRDFRDLFRYAKVWGPSAKFPGQNVGIGHVLKDQDVLSILVKKTKE